MKRKLFLAGMSATLRAPCLAITLGILGTLGACGGNTPAQAPAASAPVITLAAPVTHTVAGSAALDLSASSSDGGAIAWQLAAGSPGSLSAASGGKVSYIPPKAGTLAASTTVTVTASSGAARQSQTLTVAPETGKPGLYLLAGNAVAEPGGNDADGPVASARFTDIRGLSSDAAGNLYVLQQTDGNAPQSTLRKVGVDGTVSTLFRMGAQPFWFGQTQLPASMDLAHLNGIQSSPAGNLYLAVRSVHSNGWSGAIYLVSPQGAWSVLAGNPTTGASQYSDGVGAAATFNSPVLRGMDAAGNLYVFDAVPGGAYRKITPGGAVSTIAALPPETAVTIQGSSYTVAPSGNTVGRHTPGAGYDIVAGINRQDGLALGALPGSLPRPYAIAALGGEALAVATSQAILKLVPPAAPAAPAPPALSITAQQTQTLAGGKPLLLSASTDMASVNWTLAPGSPGALAVLDGKTARYTPPAASAVTAHTAVTVTASAGGNRQVVVLTVFPDPGAPRLSLLAGSLRPAAVGDGADGAPGVASFWQPRSLSADLNGNLYVLQTNAVNPVLEYGLSLRKVTPDGMASTVRRAGSVFIGVPGSVTADRAGNIYIADSAQLSKLGGQQSHIVRIAPDGSESVIAGAAAGFSEVLADGAGPQAIFTSVQIAGIDGQDQLWLTDYDNGSYGNVPQPVLRTLATDGTVRSTATPLPPEWAGDQNGNRYRIEGHTIVRRAPDGSESVIAGDGEAGFQLGTLPGKLYHPSRLTRTGPATYVFFNGSAIVQLVVPH